MLRTIIALVFLALPCTVFAQSRPLVDADAIPATLIADQVSVAGGGDTITATGAVEIFYENQRLTARAITYDATNDVIRAEGPIRLETSDGVIILASMAELSRDMRDGIVRGARLILNRQLQIASAEGRRSQGRFNTLDKVVASSCRICEGSETPVWQIRAKRIVHDELKRRIYFESAYLDLFGVPIAYLPALRIPEPGVERATGILAPELSSSDIYGYGIKLPYYITLGDHADATLTPFITTEGGKILETEFRQNFRRANLTFNSAVAFDDGFQSDDLRGFIDSEGYLELNRGFVGRFQLNVVSDRNFLREFDYSDSDRLVSFARIQRTRSNDHFDFRLEGYQSLRDQETQGQVPFLLPAVNYRRIKRLPGNAGRIGLSADVANITRTNGRDVIRIGGNVDYRREFRTGSGIEIATIGDLQFDAYQINNDADFSEQFTRRLVPTGAVEIRWPWIKTSSKATHIIEPVAQFIYSEQLQSAPSPNEDSLLPELDETNLFALNRFPGRDASEQGYRANIGVNYLRYDPDGWTFGITLGQVFRTTGDDDFPLASGLRGATSDLVAAMSLDLDNGLRFVGRSLFAPNTGDFRRADLEFAIQTDRFDLETSYVFLASDTEDLSLNQLPERQEIAFDGRYRLARHWEVEAGFRYDIAESRASLASAGVTYGNECIRVGLAASRRYTETDEVPSSTNIALTVNLAGLGSKSDDNWPSRRCGSGLR